MDDAVKGYTRFRKPPFVEFYLARNITGYANIRLVKCQDTWGTMQENCVAPDIHIDIDINVILLYQFYLILSSSCSCIQQMLCEQLLSRDDYMHTSLHIIHT